MRQIAILAWIYSAIHAWLFATAILHGRPVGDAGVIAFLSFWIAQIAWHVRDRQPGERK